MDKLLKLKQLYTLKMFGEEYFEGFLVKDDEITNMPEELRELNKMVQNCHRCNLSKTRKNVVFGEGNPDAEIMFIGEAPGREEDLQGRPFVGKSGDMVTKMIQKVLLLKREDVYIANIIKCRPPQNRNPEIEEIDACKGYLLKQIEIIKPKIIVLLGNIALHSLLNLNIGITKARGKLYDFNGIKVIPTFHPSYLLRNPSKKVETLQDLKFIKELL